MLVGTHMLIGQRVYDNLQESFKVNMNKKGFIYGNIKPDLDYRLSSKSHCMEDSLDFVLDEINRLLLLNEIVYIQQFSIDMGVINHFLADFFCSPHYHKSKEFDGIIKHMNYEFNLHKTFKKMIREEALDISKLKTDKYIRNTLLNTILSLEDDYKKQKQSMENDIYYALRAATIASNYILDNSILNINKHMAA